MRVVQRYSGTGSVDKFVSPSTRVLPLVRSLEKDVDGSGRLAEAQTESAAEGSVRLVIEDETGTLLLVLARVVSAEDERVVMPKDDREVALEEQEAVEAAAAAAASLSPRSAKRAIAESEAAAAAAAAAAATTSAAKRDAGSFVRVRVHYKSVLSPHFVTIEVPAGATASDVLAKALPALASSKRKEGEVDLTAVHRLCNSSWSMQTHRLNAFEPAVSAGTPSGGEFFVVPLGRSPPAGASARDQRNYAVAAGYLVPTTAASSGATTLRRFTTSTDLMSLESEATRRASEFLSGSSSVPRASLRTRSASRGSTSAPSTPTPNQLSSSASAARASILIPADPGDSASRQRRLSAGAPQLAPSLGDTTSVTLRLGRRFEVDEEIATLIEEDEMFAPPPTPPTSPPPPDAPPAPDLTPPPSSIASRPPAFIPASSPITSTLKAHIAAASTLTDAALAEASEARLLIVSEWIDTESLYVSTLELVVRAYIRPLSDPKSSPLTKTEVNTVFSTWESLARCNKILLDELTKLGGASWNVDSCIGPVVLMLSPYMKLYTMFAEQYDLSRRTLQDLYETKKGLRDLCAKASKQHTMMDPSTLAECLRLPLSRMADYMDFLRRLIKVTPLRHPDRPLCRDALRLIVGFAKHADSSLAGGGGTAGIDSVVQGGRASGLRSQSASERGTPTGGITSSLADMSSTFLGLAERELEGRKTDLERTADVVRTLGPGWEDLYAPHRRFIDRLSRCQVEHVSSDGSVRRWLPATLFLFNDLLLVQVNGSVDRAGSGVGSRRGSFISRVRRNKSLTLSTDGEESDSESSSGSSSGVPAVAPVVQLPLHLLWIKNIDVVDKLVELLTPDRSRCLVLSFPANSDRSRWVVALSELISDSLLGRAKHAQRLRVDVTVDVFANQQHAMSSFLTPPANPSAPAAPPPLAEDEAAPTCPRCSARPCTTTVLPLPEAHAAAAAAPAPAAPAGEATRERVCMPCALDYWYRLDSPSPTTPVDPRIIRNEDGIRECSQSPTPKAKTVASNALGQQPPSSRLRRGSMVIRRLSSSGLSRPVRGGLRPEELRIIDIVPASRTNTE